MISYRIPAYQVAAAVVLLMVGMLFTVPKPTALGPDGIKAVNIMDSTFTDSSSHKGINLHEDSIFSKYLIESL